MQSSWNILEHWNRSYFAPLLAHGQRKPRKAQTIKRLKTAQREALGVLNPRVPSKNLIRFRPVQYLTP
jgi:hypothetical protein